MAHNDDLDSYVDIEEFDRETADAEVDSSEVDIDTEENASTPDEVVAGKDAKTQPFWKTIAIFSLILASISSGIAIYFATKQPATPQMPAGHATMMGQGSSQQKPTVDQQAEKKYLDILAANPNDAAALKELAKVYLLGGSDDQALEIERRVLALDPNDTNALLEYGVAYFNKGDYEAAEKQWLRVAELDPTNVESHYNLGFLYMTLPTPNQDKMQEHWNKVIELAPDSDMAKTVSGHLSGGAVATPTAKKS